MSSEVDDGLHGFSPGGEWGLDLAEPLPPGLDSPPGCGGIGDSRSGGAVGVQRVLLDSTGGGSQRSTWSMAVTPGQSGGVRMRLGQQTVGFGSCFFALHLQSHCLDDTSMARINDHELSRSCRQSC